MQIAELKIFATDCTDEHRLCNCVFVVLKKPGHNCHLFITEAGCFCFLLLQYCNIVDDTLSSCPVAVVKYFITNAASLQAINRLLCIAQPRVVSPSGYIRSR
jgi:hypothetical protein